jgi:hypothetical protein
MYYKVPGEEGEGGIGKDKYTPAAINEKKHIE